jgi:hypothetical protein
MAGMMARVKTQILAGSAAVGVAGVLAAGSFSPGLLALAVSAAAVVAGIGWLHLLDVPAKKSQAAAIAGAGIASVAGAYLAPAGTAMMWMPAAVALGLGAIFLIQLVRGTGQSHRLESTLGAAGGVFIVAQGAGWVAAARLPVAADHAGLLLVAGTSAAVALAACLLPWPDRVTAPVAVTAAAVTGLLGAVLMTTQFGMPVLELPAALIGAVCGAVFATARRLVLAHTGPMNVAAALAVGLAPVLALGSLVYFLAKLLAS